MTTFGQNLDFWGKNETFWEDLHFMGKTQGSARGGHVPKMDRI